MSLLPNVIFGWVPFIVWLVLPHIAILSNFLLAFSGLSNLNGAGDYLNAYNAIRQMPKGSMQQLSGMSSYWFMPQTNFNETIMEEKPNE